MVKVEKPLEKSIRRILEGGPQKSIDGPLEHGWIFSG